MVTVEILDYNGNFVNAKTFGKDDAPFEIPQKGDTICLHFVDNKTNVTVLRREFDVAKPDVIRIITDFVKYNPNKVDETLLP